VINLENVQKIVSMAYLPHATDAFGDAGARSIVLLLDAVKLMFMRCPPESIVGTVTVLVGMSATPNSPVLGAFGVPTTPAGFEQIGLLLARAPPGHHCFLEMMPDGTYRYLQSATDIDITAIAADALVYRYHDGVDRILAKGYDDYVVKVSPLALSNFAHPTLKNLEDALEYYSRYILETRCRILADVWEGGVDGPRLVLKNKPEALMRDSLVQALQFLLRDANARPEHNTDETKPVDVRVEWFGSGASAMIEVKWLGRSTAVSRNAASGPTYTEYGPRRAQEGADQLADYLDREARHTSSTTTRGYLAIFDARRKDVKGPADALTSANALHFLNDDLIYNPDHSMSRSDFATPIRFFLNPRKSHFA
jgi:hypothetical protein